MNRLMSHLGLHVLALLSFAAHADGNVWAGQTQGRYVPHDYSLQQGRSPITSNGASMGSYVPPNLAYPARPSGAPGDTPPPAQTMLSPGIQPPMPVPPDHPAWLGGYPGLPSATSMASPAMITGIPWHAR